MGLLSKKKLVMDSEDLLAFEQMRVVQSQHAYAVETGKIPEYGGDRYASNYDLTGDVGPEPGSPPKEKEKPKRMLINAESEVSSCCTTRTKPLAGAHVMEKRIK
eukprot:3164415-Pyramimonas_sp.AAC.2